MKIINTCLIAAILTLGLASCGQDDQPSNTEAKESQQSITNEASGFKETEAERSKNEAAKKSKPAEPQPAASSIQAEQADSLTPSPSLRSTPSNDIDGAIGTESLLEEKAGDDMERMD